MYMIMIPLEVTVGLYVLLIRNANQKSLVWCADSDYRFYTDFHVDVSQSFFHIVKASCFEIFSIMF